LQLQSNGTTALTVDASQNVGVGTASPAAKLDVRAATAVLQVKSDTGTNPVYQTFNNTGGDFYIGREDSTGGAFGTTAAYASVFYASGAYPMVFFTNATERARITSGGDFLIGTTSNPSAYKQVLAWDGAVISGLDFRDAQAAAGSAFAAAFRRAGTAVGTISTTLSATSFNTASDYRLKNTIAPMTGALDKVALLKPCTYKWNVDGSDGQGFIAHELQEVVEGCVTGEKDAVETYTDEDGNEATRPVYQGIDTSFLVATLTAAIQELKAIVDAQGAEIAALKGAAA
jgi:hypothetical protein